MQAVVIAGAVPQKQRGGTSLFAGEALVQERLMRRRKDVPDRQAVHPFVRNRQEFFVKSLCNSPMRGGKGLAKYLYSPFPNE